MNAAARVALALATIVAAAPVAAHAGDARAGDAHAGDARAGDADDCGAPKRLDGIDVSSWQGAIDWRRVRKAGIVFAFARVADGLDADARFADNFAAMRRARIRRGAYQYFRAGADPEAQADLAVRALRRAGRADLPLVADVETDDGQPREVVQAQLERWLRRVERKLHVRPLVYTSPAHGALLDGHFGAWPLWVAHYEVACPALPDGWERWTFWQRAQTGRVDGIAGDVDLDAFAGTRAALRRLGHRLHAVASGGSPDSR